MLRVIDTAVRCNQEPGSHGSRYVARRGARVLVRGGGRRVWVLGWRAERLDAGQLNRNCRRRAAGLAVSQATARAASERVCVHAPPCVHFLDSRGRHDHVPSSLHIHFIFTISSLEFWASTSFTRKINSGDRGGALHSQQVIFRLRASRYVTRHATRVQVSTCPSRAH